MATLDTNSTELTVNHIYLQIAYLIKITIRKIFKRKKGAKIATNVETIFSPITGSLKHKFDGINFK